MYVKKSAQTSNLPLFALILTSCSDSGANLEFQVQAYQERITGSTAKKFIKIQSLNDKAIQIADLSLSGKTARECTIGGMSIPTRSNTETP
jgi:hypothetical protein